MSPFATGITAYDPRHQGIDGDVLRGDRTIEEARRNGAAVLPFDPDRANEDAPGGYCRVGYGVGGLVVDAPGGARLCPMSLRLQPGRAWVYWAAVLERRAAGCYGTIRLVSDRSSAMGAGLSGVGDDAVSVGALGMRQPIDLFLDENRVVIGGRRRCVSVNPDVVGLRLQVSGTGFAILAAAVTQSRIDAAYP